MNVYLKRRRFAAAAKRAEPAGAGGEPVPDPPAPASQLAELLDAELRRALAAAVDELPPQMRACLLLRVHQRLPYRDVAAVMRVSVDTVKSHLFQARARLNRRLADAGRPDLEPLPREEGP